MTQPRDEGGAGFGAQWFGGFVYPVRAALTASADEERDVPSVAGAIGVEPADAFKRIIYTESHDEDANGSSRVPEEIWPGYADSWASKKRATLGSALVLTSPGIPMLFQGQELIEGSWFADDDPLDWSLRHRHKGLLRLHRDLVRLRRNVDDTTRGLKGADVLVHHVDTGSLVLGFHRWEHGGARDDVVVLASFSSTPYPEYRVGVPRAGRWRVRFNSDWDGYDEEFATVPALDAEAEAVAQDGMQHSIVVGVGPYTVVILSQDD